jgi:ribosomal protein S18 acetylase RimI-like enzyme
MPPAIELLGSRHDRAAFSCGVASLDDYIRRQAGQDMRRDLAVCYVLCDPESSAIIGYYTLSATAFEPTALPQDLTRRLPRYPVLPATLLGRLAVDSTFRGRGMGELLLVDAMLRTLHAGIGTLAMVVDALDGGATAFYERFGFQRFEDAPERLYLPMATVRQLFAAR